MIIRHDYWPCDMGMPPVTVVAQVTNIRTREFVITNIFTWESQEETDLDDADCARLNVQLADVVERMCNDEERKLSHELKELARNFCGGTT